ncbi:MAG TPA: hypothetical protein VMT53_05420 [Terriglobales bacterium]|nr:hypothetical protein [Terriglobales bacterium]
MAASNEWTEWHLTPRGWERGSEREDGPGIKEKPAPADRVLTYRWKEYLSSVFSTMDRTSQELWRSDDEAAIKVLLEKFGDPPQSL